MMGNFTAIFSICWITSSSLSKDQWVLNVEDLPEAYPPEVVSIPHIRDVNTRTERHHILRYHVVIRIRDLYAQRLVKNSVIIVIRKPSELWKPDKACLYLLRSRDFLSKL